MPNQIKKHKKKWLPEHFTMIKPDAVANGHIGNILAMITNAGFKIVSKINSTYRC
jgi:nucleoside diphosphate kinase